MFELSTYNCCCWWQVPIARNHPNAVVHHLTNIPPSPRDDEPSLDLKLINDYGSGTETSPIIVRRNRQLNEEPTNKIGKRLRFVCMSDTHNKIDRIKIPNGDVFVHCGDAVNHLTSASGLRVFNQFVGTLPHKHKIFVSGNHCVSLDPTRPDLTQELLTNLTYVQDRLVEIDGIRIYGSPWRPKRGCCYLSEAFGYDARLIQEDKWSHIPDSIDLLLTHCPPYSIRDYSRLHGARLGCPALLDEIVTRVKPRIHLFGHMHECYGASLYKPEENPTLEKSNSSHDILFVNLAIKHGGILGEPIVIDYIY